MSDKPLYQSDASYKRSLDELMRRVKAGVPLKAVDSDEIGDKYTECTLGLCDRSVEKAMDGVYRADHHVCPHDGRFLESDGTPTGTERKASSGCFFACHIFQKKGGSPKKRIASAIDTYQHGGP